MTKIDTSRAAVEAMAAFLDRRADQYRSERPGFAQQYEIAAALLCAVADERDQARETMAKIGQQLDKLLDHCPNPECDECSQIICPHGDPFHFHHDGCPSCVFDEQARAAASRPEQTFCGAKVGVCKPPFCKDCPQSPGESHDREA